MIKLFRITISLNNLRSKSCKGQIATLLTLLMVALLVLILITINTGEVALKTTAIANAADAAALQLGSQLSTIANTYKESLEGEYEDCSKTGWGPAVVAALVAIAAVVITIVSAGSSSPLTGPLALMAIGALAGGIGAGAAAAAQGYKIKEKAFWNQVLLGVSIGAAVGSCGSLFVSAPTTIASGSTATVEAGAQASTLTVTAAEGGGATTVVVAGGEPIMVAAGTSATISVPAGTTATITAGSTTTVTATGGATVTAGTTAATGATEVGTSSGEVAQTVETAKTGGDIATTSGQVAKTGSTVGNAIKTGYNAVNSAVHWLCSLPGRGIDAALKGLGAKSGWGTVLLSGQSKAITIGNAANMALQGLGSTYFGTSAVQNRIYQSMAAYGRMISSLNENDSVREGVFLSGVAQIIDDPNDTDSDSFAYDCDGDGTLEFGGDPCDSDSDGDTKESVPYFQFWWDRRLAVLKKVSDTTSGVAKDFWNGNLSSFSDYLDSDGGPIDALTCVDSEGNPDDCEITTFLSTLENAGHDVGFWQNGPTEEELAEWLSDCPSQGTSGCPEDYLKSCGYDETDSAAEDFYDFVELVDSIDAQEEAELSKKWYYWLGWLYQDPNKEGYDADADDSYHRIFNTILYGSEDFQGLNDWLDGIDTIENNLVECVIDPNSGEITNAPCKHTSEPYYATTDGDADDEFIAVRSKINDLMNRIGVFNGALESLNSQINEESKVELDEFGGTNPVKYTWNDSLGDHTVTMQTSSFKVPWIEAPDKRGNWWSGEACVVLRDYEDTDGKNTWVKLRREDPSNRQVGILGFWRSGVIERTAHVAFNESQVKLVKW